MLLASSLEIVLTGTYLMVDGPMGTEIMVQYTLHYERDEWPGQ
jgi:hypothetical protein